MINENLYPQAYKEVIEILQYIPEKEYDKIPNELIDFFKSNMDKNYNYEVTCFDNFQNQEMLKETEVILAILFRDYWATDEQKKIIVAKENYDMKKKEALLKEKFNEINLFKNKEVEIEKNNNFNNNDIYLIKYKEPKFIQKFLKKLKIF